MELPTLSLRSRALPLTPGDPHSSSNSPSRTSSPLRNLGADKLGSLSPPFNASPATLLPPPSPNAASEGFGPPSPSPTKSSFGTKQSKKSNPLTDLVESEREYVGLLGVIIRKVAGAWSKANFPPKELDVMFRGIEGIYKANKRLLTQLKEIGLNPASPKDLGDLLMRWVDDLDKPYNKFCNNFATGFDTWEPVASNTLLPPILSTISSEHPIPQRSLDTDTTFWTLDALFALPRARLKYYKKLYTRLLKSTEAGRSDHKLLTSAVEKLEILMATLSQKETVQVGQSEHIQLSTTSDAPIPIVDPKAPEHNQTHRPPSNTGGSETTDDQTRRSFGSSVPPITSTSTMSMPVSNLEKRLSTERVLDLFTLKPKAVRLQMNPSSLTFTRTLRLSHDVEITFTPRSAPDSPQLHPLGHIFLLTDLFLVCERMTADEKQAANSGADSQDYDMWLLYPPLAGKHLRVLEHPDKGEACSDNALQVLILKKETLVLETQSKANRDFLMKEFNECIEAGNLLTSRPGQAPPPPVPPLKHLPPSSPHTSDPNTTTSSAANSSGLPSGIDLPVKPLEMRGPDQNQNGLREFSQSVTDSLHSHAPFAPLQGGQPGSGTVSLNNNPGQPFYPNSHTQPHPSATSGYDPARESLRGFPQRDSNPVNPPPRGASNPSYGNLPSGPRPFAAPIQPNNGPHFPVQQNYPGQFPSRVGTPNSFQPPPHSYEPMMNHERPPSSSALSLHKSASARSLSSSYRQPSGPLPPIPGHVGMYDGPPNGYYPRDGPVSYSSAPHVHQPQARAPFPPSSAFNPRATSFAAASSWGPNQEPSPPTSPMEDERPFSGPVTSTITAQFKCKVFLKLQHGQWKALGGAKLKLYLQQPTNIKQLVVEADSKDKAMLISTIVLTDGVERVGKTGVAIELSDKGSRTGIVYMIQLRNETSASGLFDSLLAGSDRATNKVGRG
ncbi:hypothetical protein BU17DRAFT_38575 [Hysterangium stoloniferum]|nr:hypothetical protein BU17DRAFT_38575 [Hysterangium stoloniferum]